MYTHYTDSMENLIKTEEGRNALLNSSNRNSKAFLAQNGFKLEELKNDPEWIVRMHVALHGVNLHNYVNDESSAVRRIVAKNGIGLETLKDDDSALVRLAVAQQNYKLTEFVDDHSFFIRQYLADKGVCLDVLVHDRNPVVRSAVACCGYAPDILGNDSIEYIRELSKKASEAEEIVTLYDNFMSGGRALKAYKFADGHIELTGRLHSELISVAEFSSILETENKTKELTEALELLEKAFN